MDYQLKLHLTGLLEALGLPPDTYLTVGVLPDQRQDWTDEKFDALVEELGGSVKTRVSLDDGKQVLKRFRVQHVHYGAPGADLWAYLSIHSPTSETKI